MVTTSDLRSPALALSGRQALEERYRHGFTLALDHLLTGLRREGAAATPAIAVELWAEGVNQFLPERPDLALDTFVPENAYLQLRAITTAAAEEERNLAPLLLLLLVAEMPMTLRPFRAERDGGGVDGGISERAGLPRPAPAPGAAAAAGGGAGLAALAERSERLAKAAEALEMLGLEPRGQAWEAALTAKSRTLATERLNYDRVNAFIDRGIERKRWVTRRDDRVRDSHAALDGVAIPVSDAFLVGPALSPMQYPGDPAGPTSETQNCRCVLIAA